MATAYVTEYGSLVGDRLAVAQEPELKTQVITIGSETDSVAFLDNTRVIRVHVDAICSCLVGKSPDATTSSKRLAANQTEYFGVRPGDKISFISNT